MVKNRKLRKTLLWLLLITLFAGLVWAVGEEMLQANKDVQQTAAVGADEEMAAIETTAIVKPKAKTSNIDWATINKYEAQLKQNNNAYLKLIDQAGAEKQSGTVSAATRSAGLDCANQFSQISEQLAAVYEKGNCITKAKTVRAAAKSRLANAQMAFNDMDTDAISAYNDDRNAMSDANIASIEEDKANGNPEDIKTLKANMVPRLNKMAKDTGELLGSVTRLLDQVRKVAGGDANAIAGCAKDALTGSTEGPGGLIRPLTSLMNLLKNMGGNLAQTAQLIMSM